MQSPLKFRLEGWNSRNENRDKLYNAVDYTTNKSILLVV
jgi:hypothetical protein